MFNINWTSNCNLIWYSFLKSLIVNRTNSSEFKTKRTLFDNFWFIIDIWKKCFLFSGFEHFLWQRLFLALCLLDYLGVKFVRTARFVEIVLWAFGLEGLRDTWSSRCRANGRMIFERVFRKDCGNKNNSGPPKPNYFKLQLTLQFLVCFFSNFLLLRCRKILVEHF